MVGRMVQAADFKRLLAAPQRARSAHFAVHHLSARPLPPRRTVVHQSSTDLSTDGAPLGTPPVDNMPDGHWLGCVIPKRLARRSVTRNLMRRQIRQAVVDGAASLPPGLWVVRLRAPFDPKVYVSAASEPLRDAVRAELRQLIQRAARATAPAGGGRGGV